MALPPQGTVAPAAPSGTWQKVYAGQSTLTYLVCRGLDRAAGAGFKVDTPVTTTALKQGQQKSWLFFEARRTAALSQDLTADGRLFLGAKFTFFFKRLLAVYQKRLDTGTPAQRLAAAAAFANVDRIRFRLLAATQKTRANTQTEKGQLQQTLGEQQDAAAFDQAAALLEKGQQPDLQMMQQALRHADRLDSQSDNSLGLVPDQRSATR
jgi:hypothetical protein